MTLTGTNVDGEPTPSFLSTAVMESANAKNSLSEND